MQKTATQSQRRYFETFPRRELIFKMTRRGLLQSFANNYKAAEKKKKGEAVYNLSILGTVPDEQLAALIPHILPNSDISTADSQVWGCIPGSNRRQALFLAESDALFVFNLMNGRHTLHDISLHLAKQMHWPQEQAFAFTRGLFLHLVQLRICLPQG